MEEYLEGYGEEIIPMEDVGDEVDDILEALSGYEDDDPFETGWDDEDEDMGADDLVGAIVRRLRRLPRRRRAPRRRAALRRVRPRQFREYPLGLGVTAIAAGATAVITVNPQLPFKLTRLSTPSAGLIIDNIQIGTVSQFVAAGGVASECFGPTATDTALKGDTAVPGVAIQLTVTNPTGAAVNLTGMLKGLVAQ